MLWQRRREKQKFRSFITFSRSSTYTGFSLRHFLTQDTSPSYTFPGQLCFILSFLFPYLGVSNLFFPNFMLFLGYRRMTLRSLRTFHSQNSETGIRDFHYQERLETKVPAFYPTSYFHIWLRMVQC